ncbi:MAG: NADH-quinone oxidoreductase subunit G [Proteobacteria bacterium]|nr:NADH-quinone oxidoreductase subunit G [Pseudomonadota bacterium]
MVTIEIDGKKIETESGKMIIEVADAHNIPIPRFCYHKKLSIAANCRMCLVEVEKSRKPLPACATPVADGMKVFTQSQQAIISQKAVMEFLLINHPLDCPICDQGGECELQDVSMGYGPDISRYTEEKRVVDDENLGSLISTDMTRCIQCTRCVRFGEEVAGFRELGATDRGENMQIGTYVKSGMRSEISGNIIDLCPVGALTSKPYRFTARAWELTQANSIAPHDCLGSHIYLHTRRQEVMRVVPKENEALNETWLSDRDRYSYAGLNHDRVDVPLINNNGIWQETDWSTALNTIVEKLRLVIEKSGAEQIAALASPSSTVEEFYLLQKLMRGLGSHNIDHRLKQCDFSDQTHASIYPHIDFPYADLENKEAILLIGSNIHSEQPLAAVRLRKAVLRGASAWVINPVDYDMHFPVKKSDITTALVEHTAKIAKALLEDKPADIPAGAEALLTTIHVDSGAKEIAHALKKANKAVVILGAIAEQHPQAATLRALAHTIGHLSGARIVIFTEGANSAGAWLAGAIPHREAAGKSVAKFGLTARESLEAKLKAYILFGIEPELDCANPHLALEALKNADFVVVMSAYKNKEMTKYADIILPITPFTETSGTFVNLSGIWQSFQGCVPPFSEARPGWKVLRVLGNFFDLPDFEYASSEQVSDELKALTETINLAKGYSWYFPKSLKESSHSLQRIAEWPIYRIDSLVRRSEPLQRSATLEPLGVRMNGKTAENLQLKANDMALVQQNDNEVNLPVIIDARIPDNVVGVAAGYAETAHLGDTFSEIIVKKA